MDPNTLNLDPDPGFWPNLDPDPDSGPDPDRENNFREKQFSLQKYIFKEQNVT